MALTAGCSTPGAVSHVEAGTCAAPLCSLVGDICVRVWIAGVITQRNAARVALWAGLARLPGPPPRRRLFMRCCCCPLSGVPHPHGAISGALVSSGPREKERRCHCQKLQQ